MTDAIRLMQLAWPQATDGDLLGRYARDRDEAAFAELVARNGPLVFRACRSVLGESAAAEDAFQTTFLVLARKAGRLAAPRSVAGWLHATAVRVARDALRSAIRTRRREAHVAGLCEAGTRSPDEMTWREVREAIDTELAELPEKYRTPLVLCYLQELSYDEAARRAGCTVGALRGRLERGKELLRGRLKKHGLPLALPLLALGTPEPVSAAVRDSTLAAVAGVAVVRAGWRALIAPAVVVVAALGVSAAWSSRPSPVQPPQPAAKLDHHGDPLPDGALMRLGTTRSRAPISGFGIAADGTIVTVGPSAEVSIWSPTSDKPTHTTRLPIPRAEADYRPRPAVSPDGRFVAAATTTGLGFFDVRTGKAFAERKVEALREYPTSPFARVLKFFPDGSKLVTGMADTTALVWPAPPRPKGNPLDDKGRAAAWESLRDADAAKAWAAVWALADDPGSVAFLREKLKPLAALAAEESQRPAGEALRAMRAVAAVELAGTDDARKLLAELAAGPAGAVLTAEATRAKERGGK